MKRILFVLASFWLCCNLWAQSQELEFYYYNSAKIRLLVSLLQYNTQPLRDFNLDIYGQSGWEERLNFNQETRRSLLGSVLNQNFGLGIHSLNLEYGTHFDLSDLDPSAYVNQNGKVGYRLYLAPMDSLAVNLEIQGLIRNEKDRYQPGNHLKSQGLGYLASAHYAFLSDVLHSSISANHESHNLNWEKYQSSSAAWNLSWGGDYLDFEGRANFQNRKDEIYNLISDSKQGHNYQHLDSQLRRQYDFFGSLAYYPAESISFTLWDNYVQGKTRLKTNDQRNSGEQWNHVNLDCTYYIRPGLQLFANASHQYTIKDFSYTVNTRHIENRNVSASVNWEYAPYDSLSLNLGLNLASTYFPKNYHRWDNDLRNRYIGLAWKHYFRDYLRSNQRLLYSVQDDIYINGLLSANNHSIQSYSYLPQLDVLLGDRLCFSQSYQIRADYADYIYQNKLSDKLFRQLGYSYALIFDTFPYIARAEDNKWLLLPYRPNRGSAFKSVLSFSYEENQYADKNGDYYLIHTKNRRYLAAWELGQDIGEYYFSIQPQYLWGTWQEYSLTAGISWYFDNQSYLELTFSPISEELSNINWRSSVNLSLRF